MKVFARYIQKVPKTIRIFGYPIQVSTQKAYPVHPVCKTRMVMQELQSPDGSSIQREFKRKKTLAVGRLKREVANWIEKRKKDGENYE